MEGLKVRHPISRDVISKRAGLSFSKQSSRLAMHSQRRHPSVTHAIIMQVNTGNSIATVAGTAGLDTELNAPAKKWLASDHDSILHGGSIVDGRRTSPVLPRSSQCSSGAKASRWRPSLGH
jgi:hypothetical protein